MTTLFVLLSFNMSFEELKSDYALLQKNLQDALNEIAMLKAKCCCPAGIVCKTHQLNRFYSQSPRSVATEYMEKRKEQILKGNKNARFIQRMETNDTYNQHPSVRTETDAKTKQSQSLSRKRQPILQDSHVLYPMSPLPEEKTPSSSTSPTPLHIEPFTEDDLRRIEKRKQRKAREAKEKVVEEEDVLIEAEEKEDVVIEAEEKEDVLIEEEEKEEDVLIEVEEEEEKEDVLIEAEEKKDETDSYNRYILKNMKELKEICKEKGFKLAYKYKKKMELVKYIMDSEFHLSSSTPSPTAEPTTMDLSNKTIKELKDIAKQWKGHSRFTKKEELKRFIQERL